MTVDEERTLERTLAQESEDDLLQLAREEVDEIDIPVMRMQGWVIPDGLTAGDIVAHKRRCPVRYDFDRNTLDGTRIPVSHSTTHWDARGTGHGGAALDDAKREDHARVVAHLATIGVIAPDWWAVYSP